MTTHRSLIDTWLPIAELSVESQRERGASSALPPLYFLHVWWARRPLTASRAAVLGSLLPAWSEDWPDHLLDRFPLEKEYREWFKTLLGIRGDPVAARLKIRDALEKGTRIANPYEGPRAFTLGPSAEQLDTFRELLQHRWGTSIPTVLDPTAGGGSIPFEAIRFGLPTQANELNPVASFVLEGTLTLPARYGPDLADDITYWGGIWTQNVRKRVGGFFPSQGHNSAQTYFFARTVACPETGKQVPLSPNWWLRKGQHRVAVRLIANPEMDDCMFEIVEGNDIDFDPDQGTVNRGKGRSPWKNTTISGDYIKSEAQAGRMGSQLYAIAAKKGKSLVFRLPDRQDQQALADAETELGKVIDRWLIEDVIPNEDFPEVASDMRPHHYGMSKWRQFFSSRQLLVMGVAVEELRLLQTEMEKDLDSGRAAAVTAYLAMALDKMADYNAHGAVWHPSRTVVAHVFARHDYSFKWSFAELNIATPNLGMEWALNQIRDAYRGIAKLIDPSRHALFSDRPERAADLVTVHNRDAADLPLPDGSVQAVVMDPPYYDNVQYAELSDFFYVWLKRTAGHLYPQFFTTELAEKAIEAVANPARFAALDKKNSRRLAQADYQAKMTRIFAETHRVLSDDGVLTVMFNHKKTEAWDTLGQSLIESGFQIEASWPIHTESEHSLHQAKKAASASTILLSCRKRVAQDEPTWWDDLAPKVRRAARNRAERFRAEGVEGVDLYISTFGPALSVISRQWPVYTSEVNPDTGQPMALRPEEALELARQEVARLRLQGMLSGRKAEFDPVTDWYLLAWDSFRAGAFPYDEARKLALALGTDLDRDLRPLRIVAKKASNVKFQEPIHRRRKGLADPGSDSFDRLIDATHALMIAHREDGIHGAEAFLQRTRLGEDSRFRALLQALINAIPRTKIKDAFARSEAEDLDGLAVLFPDLQLPEDPSAALQPTQTRFDLGS
ncbi:MAG: DUF1156 domain-containing protein [bacterium]|nr:DUF1156 domain-containing protein [bacterium]